ncbi:MAG: class I SAM-dependent methyltransferase [Candidatus Dadabacteria bacterium]|nr:class I SAM-dependent methyltransferase [Candidatus Dadabacteria bacterium]
MSDTIEPKEIMKTARGFMLSKTLLMANELGVFEALGRGSESAAVVADKILLSEKGIERLLNALCSIGMLTKEGDVYSLPESLREYLLRDGDASLNNYLNLYAHFWNVWSDMKTVIRDGEPAKSMMELLSKDEDTKEMFITAMADRSREATRLIPQVVDISAKKNMIDVGCGPGTYSFEWMKTYPGLKATLLDIEPALEVAKRYKQVYGIGNEATFMPGDFRDTDLGNESYDLALVANLLQMYGADDNIKLLSKVYNALTTGGMVIIHGYTLDDSETEPLGSALQPSPPKVMPTS